MSEAISWAAALFVLGAIVGSFLAALAIRWPQGRSVIGGRSSCDVCGQTLRAIDLVPLLSILLLRGRCRDCDAAIDPRHWRIELGAALIGGLAGFVVPGPAGIAGAVFGWLLLVLAVLDFTAFWLPDALTGALALAGLASGVLGLPPPLADRLIGGAAGFAALWGIAFAYRRMRGREGLGGGDPKLLGAIGLWLGWRMLPAVLLVASLVGLGAMLVARIAGRDVRRDTRVPLGTCLAIAAYAGWVAMVSNGA